MLTGFLSFRRLAPSLVLAAAVVTAPVARSATLTPSDCSKIVGDKDRLACFEKLFPPERPVRDPKADLHDNSAEEKARLEKSLKSSICRDCVKK